MYLVQCIDMYMTLATLESIYIVLVQDFQIHLVEMYKEEFVIKFRYIEAVLRDWESTSLWLRYCWFIVAAGFGGL
jgi:predicted RND superfamily exporter protein